MDNLPHNRKRPATPQDNPQASKRQGSVDRLDASHHSSSLANEDSTVSVEEHGRKLSAFMKPLIAEINKRVQRAYVNDLEQQMGMDLNAKDQRECAEFIHMILVSLNDSFSDMGSEWVEKVATEKPQGAWYRQWLNSNPDLFNSSKYLANQPVSGASSQERDPSIENQGMDLKVEGEGSHLESDGDHTTQARVSTPSIEAPLTRRPETSLNEDVERERLTMEFAGDWQQRVQEEIVRQELEIRNKTRILGAAWDELTIDGVGEVDKRATKDFERLKDDFLLTWKFRDLPLDNREVDAWLEKRRKLATFPRFLSESTVLQWTDIKSETHETRASNVKFRVTEVSTN